MPKGSQVFHGSFEEALKGSGILASSLARPAGVIVGTRLLSRASAGPVHIPQTSCTSAGPDCFSGSAFWAEAACGAEPSKTTTAAIAPEDLSAFDRGGRIASASDRCW